MQCFTLNDKCLYQVGMFIVQFIPSFLLFIFFLLFFNTFSLSESLFIYLFNFYISDKPFNFCLINLEAGQGSQ